MVCHENIFTEVFMDTEQITQDNATANRTDLYTRVNPE